MDINMLADMDSTTRISQGQSNSDLAQYLATTARNLQVDVTVADSRDHWQESPLTPLSYMWSDDDSYKYTHHEYDKYPTGSIGHEGDFDLSDPSSLTPGSDSINSDSDSLPSEGNTFAKRTQSALHQGVSQAGNSCSATLSNTHINREYPISFNPQQTMAAYHEHQVSSNTAAYLNSPLTMLEASHTRRHTSSDPRNIFPLTPIPQQRDRSNTNPSALRATPVLIQQPFTQNGLKAHAEPNQNLFVAVADLSSPFANSPSVSGTPFSVSQPLLPFPSSDSGFGYDLTTPQGTPRAGEGAPTVLGRGLLGWGDDDTPKPRKRAHSRSMSPLLGGFDISLLSSPSRGGRARAAKRARVSNTKKLAGDSNTEESRSISSSDGESDVYIPSRSPSFAPSRSASPHEGLRRRDGATGKKRATKGKAKGSAACALALISRLTSTGPGSSVGDDGDSEYTGSTGGSGTMRKRKNSHIPLPVPVPNLIKKSRGRKVPFVAPQGMVEATAPVRARRGRKSGGGAAAMDGMGTMTIGPDGGNRMYVCAVAGCGKCFVRGEHLKRHVRSIHTHDKPHACPFKGCDKSFSRRDNLGQHVRIHLQTSDALSD